MDASPQSSNRRVYPVQRSSLSSSESLKPTRTASGRLLPRVFLDIAELSILRWHFWAHNTARTGLVSQEAFVDLIKGLLGDDVGQTETEFAYQWFDTGHDGTLNVKEFIMGCAVLVHGEESDRIRYLFHMYAKGGVVELRSMARFWDMTRALERYYDLEECVNEGSGSDDGEIGIDKFSALVRKNAAILKCMDRLSRGVSKGIARLKEERGRDVIEGELADMGFGQTRYWEEGYDVFAATSTSAEGETKDYQQSQNSEESSESSGSSSESGKEPRNIGKMFEIDFEQLTFEERIGAGSFAEVWRGRWLDAPVAIKVFNKSRKARPVSLNSGLTLSKNVSDSDFGESFLCRLSVEESISSRSREESSNARRILAGHVATRTLADMDSRAQEAQAFLSEVRLLTNLRHPNVLLYLGACTNPVHPLCIVSELIDGGSLYNYLHKCLKRPPRTAEALSLALDIARGMLYLHSQKPLVLHRDLKSANILVENFSPGVRREPGSSKLKAIIIDFGLSRIDSPPAAEHVKVGCGGGGLIGSLVTMAPEVMNRERYTWAADVYSYGIVLWELFTGRLPFQGIVGAKLMYNVVVLGERPHISKSDKVPRGIEDLIMKCWSSDQSERPTFRRIVKSLNRVRREIEFDSESIESFAAEQ